MIKDPQRAPTRRTSTGGLTGYRLPASLGVTKGQVVDAAGNFTKQLDVIVFDALRTPILYRSEEEGQQLVPSEGVIAVVEVKTKLEASAISGVVENMLSVKRLSKSAYFRQQSPVIINTVNLYGQELDVFPTLYFLFAFEGGDLNALATELANATRALPLDKRVDCACVLEKGVLVNQLPNGTIDGVPGSGSVLASYPTANALLLWFILSSRLVLQAQLPPINLNAYVGPNFVF